MTMISRQHFSEADRAVQIRRAAFVDKGAQLEFRRDKGKIVLLFKMSHWIFMIGSLALKVLGILNIAPTSCNITGTALLETLTT